MSGQRDNQANDEAVAVATSSRLEVKTDGSPLVELKNGRIQFKQKSISFEKQSETLQEIVQFREMLSERIERQASPLLSIPEEHKPIIAKLAHESDKTLAALSKYIRLELLPTQDDQEGWKNESSPALIALPISAIEAVLKAVMQRNNYGLDCNDGGKVPAALCVWRWEVKEQFWDWLPKNGREKAESRQAERIQAKKNLSDIFESLPPEDQAAILDPKGTNKLSSKAINGVDTKKYEDLTNEDKVSFRSSKGKQKGEAENEDHDAKMASKVAKVTKPVDPEKALKERMKLDKKAARAEKEKKELDARKKSQSLMANFFSKPKVPISDISKPTDPNAAGPSTFTSEFERSFRPFVIKKDATLAPINWFLEAKKQRKNCASVKVEKGIIVIEDDDLTTLSDAEAPMVDAETEETDLYSLPAEDHIRSIIASLPLPVGSSRRRTPYRGTLPFKTYSPVSIREIVSRLSEAEIAGDTSLVRLLLSQLGDRCLLPAKVFIFHEDARPGYFGTWTRTSRIIGPRTPFAQDVLVFDYGYDSGEEWEEEAPGDVDDVIDDVEEEDVDAEDVDSDLDSWLVDDDVEEAGLPVGDRESSPLQTLGFPVQSTKRKAEENEKKSGKKRKVVLPLVPFAKGPHWGSSIGQSESDFFEPYRIQMFNDTPFPIDPFTFVSACFDDRQEHTKPALPNDSKFAVPSLSNRLTDPNASMNTSSLSSASHLHKKPAPMPKTAFPEVHLSFLLDKITILQSASINFLVEAIHRELREHKVKKNTIEAKVREVSEKCKEKKVWVVKPGTSVPS